MRREIGVGEPINSQINRLQIIELIVGSESVVREHRKC